VRKRRPGERRNARCVVHIAETDEQKCSRRSTVATTPIVTGDACIAGLASVPKRGQYDGAALSESGRDRVHCEMDGEIGGPRLFGGSVRWSRAEWISSRPEPGGHVDHIVPARLIRRLNAGNPDGRENLQCICGDCHGYKLQADHKLCLGDRLGYLEILRTHQFDLGRVERALALYGL